MSVPRSYVVASGHNDMTGAYFMREGSAVAGKEEEEEEEDSYGGDVNQRRVPVMTSGDARTEEGGRGARLGGSGPRGRIIIYERSGERTPHTVLICRPTVCAFVSRPSEPLSLRKAD